MDENDDLPKCGDSLKRRLTDAATHVAHRSSLFQAPYPPQAVLQRESSSSTEIVRHITTKISSEIKSSC